MRGGSRGVLSSSMCVSARWLVWFFLCFCAAWRGASYFLRSSPGCRFLYARVRFLVSFPLTSRFGKIHFSGLRRGAFAVASDT
ncbi:hypothetical protein BJ912DRAFT_977447 [Pholiota molesta]|nr:hypothetical protein BJ912DRAFT_977447 [Pholiota molesta]